MDLQRIVATDDELRAELLERRKELSVGATGGLETLGGGYGGEAGTEGLSAGTIERLAEGAYGAGDLGELEAIVLRFTRPVFLVQDSAVTPPADTAALFSDGESAVISSRVSSAKQVIDAAIPAVGRINLTNHRFDWVGTGWVVHPEIVVTNRHVAEIFAAGDNAGFHFRQAQGGRVVKASIDWRREQGRPDESVVRVEEVLWIEPDGGPDLALLRIRDLDEDGGNAPAPISLMTQADVQESVGNWMAVIGYPAQSPYNDINDQQRIFDGIYNVKRLAPGTVTAVSPDGLLDHDATTLGGNSGSVVLDLATGHAIGLHFGGIEGDRNMAVQAPVIAARIAEHA